MGYCSDFKITVIRFDSNLNEYELLNVFLGEIDYSGRIDSDLKYSLNYFNIKFYGYKKIIQDILIEKFKTEDFIIRVDRIGESELDFERSYISRTSVNDFYGKIEYDDSNFLSSLRERESLKRGVK